MQTALVSGASSGIGKAIAERLSIAGCRVIAIGRNREKLSSLARSSQNIEPIICDLSRSLERETLIKNITGQIDYLILNAGIEAHIGNVQTLTEPNLQEIMQTNLIAPMILTAQLKAKGSLVEKSRILATSSRAGDQAFRGVSSYGVTKAGLDAFMRALVEEGYLAASFIPGEVDTQIQENLRHADFLLQQFFIDAKNEGRLLHPSVTARFVHFLLCEMSDADFTGKKHNIYDKKNWDNWLGPSETIPTPDGEREGNMKTRPLDIFQTEK